MVRERDNHILYLLLYYFTCPGTARPRRMTSAGSVHTQLQSVKIYAVCQECLSAVKAGGALAAGLICALVAAPCQLIGDI